MVPAQPPLPTPANLPFHFCSGSQTSNRMCDSLVGAIVAGDAAERRQVGHRIARPGGVNDPLVIAWAVVIVVFGSR